MVLPYMLILMINFLKNWGCKGIFRNFVRVYLLQECYIFANGTTLLRQLRKNIDLLAITAFCSSKFPFLKWKVKYQIIFAKSRPKMKWTEYCSANSAPSESKFPTVQICRGSVQRITLKVEKKKQNCEIIIFLLYYNNVSLTLSFVKLNPLLSSL